MEPQKAKPHAAVCCHYVDCGAAWHRAGCREGVFLSGLECLAELPTDKRSQVKVLVSIPRQIQSLEDRGTSQLSACQL